MNQVITLGLENKLPRINTIRSFPANSKVHVRVPDFMLNAVEFIGDYCGIAQDDVYGYAIQESTEFLMQIDLENNLKDFKDNFKIDWVKYPYEIGRVKTHQALFGIDNPFIYNLLLSEFDISKKQVFNYLFGLYTQLFINEYNNNADPNYRLIFPDKQKAIDNLRKNKNFRLIKALNEFKKIHSFSRYDIIVDQSLN